MRCAGVCFGLVVFSASVACSPPERPAATQPGTSAATAATSATVASQRSNEKRWCVTGHVADANGRPLEGVEITAHCGIGTLLGTGRAISGPDGSYALWFGQGVFFLNDHSGLQAATIAPHKTGLVERNLHRQGNWLMAKRRPPESDLKGWGKMEGVVYPDQPQRIDFVMVPAATISGRLTDVQGKPIANHYVSVDADALPPSSSVLATEKTDETGRFRFTEIPAGSVWLSMRTPEDVMREVCTEKIDCSAEHVYDVALEYDPGPPPHVTLRRTESP